ncbi:hypothetical protein HPB52_013817 [Rhipicephalus sanguineus]|uniref:Uncharacterized protein n=1 Tax=Rhipicephalus sanguineus TaxID=34632 RepID=A0A9D4PIN1_RHISA|nr:hypothetical protein HPB52_013817 [Rhipicephalus sanguineus]
MHQALETTTSDSMTVFWEHHKVMDKGEYILVFRAGTPRPTLMLPRTVQQREKESSRGTAAPRARPPPPASGPSSPETHHHPYARKHQDPGPHLLSRSPLLPSLVPPASVRRLPRLSRPAYEGAEELHGDVSIDDVIDVVEETAGDNSVLVLQHMGGSKFLVCTRNASQATKLMVAEGFKINREHVAVEAVGPPVTFVNVYRFPAYLPDEVLANALAQYGKVQQGHMASACTAVYCKRCGVFGHETEGCVEECKRCGGRHGTRECFRKRSYVAAARGFPSETRTTTSATQPGSPRSLTAASSSSGLQVLRPRPRPLMPMNAPDSEVIQATQERNDIRLSPTSPSPPAAGAETNDETRINQVASNPAPRNPRAPSSEQELPEDEHAPSDNAATPPGLDDVNFPPLAAATTAPPNLDEAPIVSRGYYPLSDSEHPPPGPLPPAVTQTPGPTSGDPTPAATPMAQSGLVRRDRSRSRSPLRGDTMAATAESSHPPSLDNKHRRSKTHDLSSDSDAPSTAKSQKLGTPPSGKGHPPPGAGEKR